MGRLPILTISAVIAGAALGLTTCQAKQQQNIQNQQAKDAALQAYLDHMGQLMLVKDRPLGESKQGDAVQTLARTRTLTVLKMLDAEYNESVTTFLKESGLAGSVESTVLRLDHADLNEVALENSSVSRFDLRYTNLRDADQRAARLDIARLVFADLGGADLRGAILRDTELLFANLNDADLSGADLRGADLEKAKHLTPEQINKAGAVDSATKLPAGLRGRSRWSNTSATVLRDKVDKAGNQISLYVWRAYLQGWTQGMLDISWLEDKEDEVKSRHVYVRDFDALRKNAGE